MATPTNRPKMDRPERVLPTKRKLRDYPITQRVFSADNYLKTTETMLANLATLTRECAGVRSRWLTFRVERR
jgi:hypothetical protein